MRLRLEQLEEFCKATEAMKRLVEKVPLPPPGTIMKENYLPRNPPDPDWEDSSEREPLYRKVAGYHIGYSNESGRAYVEATFQRWYLGLDDYDKYYEQAFLRLEDGEVVFKDFKGHTLYSMPTIEDVSLLLTSSDNRDRQLGELLHKQVQQKQESQDT